MEGNPTTCTSMTANTCGTYAQSNRINRCKILWRRITPGDEIAVFFHVGGEPISGRIIRAQLHLASNNDDISSRPISIEIESHSGIPLQMHQAFGICSTIYQESRFGFIP